MLSRDKISADPGVSSSWMISFADLLSLILTFFILIYSMSSVENQMWQKYKSQLTQKFESDFFINIVDRKPELSIERVEVEYGKDTQYLFAVINDKLKNIQDNNSSIKTTLLDDKVVISLIEPSFYQQTDPSSLNTPETILKEIAQALSTMKNGIEVICYDGFSTDTKQSGQMNWELALNRSIFISNILRKSGYPYRIKSFGKSSVSSDNLFPDASLGEKQEISKRIDIIVRSEKATF